MAPLDPARFVFVDESGTNRALTPRYGRAPRGQRATGVVPRNPGPNTTLCAALAPTGITAAMTLEGAVDRPAFEVFVGEVLAPTLTPGQVVLWDNLSVHQSATAQALLAARGCELRPLPPYSPDFSPIEHAFAKVKEHLRRAEARTQVALEAAIGQALTTITAADARGWFAHCGYPLRDQLL